MTRDEAIEIRQLQLQGKPVDAALAAEALALIQASAGTWKAARKKPERKPRARTEPLPPEPEPEPETAAPSQPVVVEAVRADNQLEVPRFQDQQVAPPRKAKPKDVLQVLRPWAVITPNTTLDPEAYVWPRLGAGVDIDAVHGKKQ
jgi:hypothetical protein